MEIGIAITIGDTEVGRQEIRETCGRVGTEILRGAAEIRMVQGIQGEVAGNEMIEIEMANGMGDGIAEIEVSTVKKALCWLICPDLMRNKVAEEIREPSAAGDLGLEMTTDSEAEVHLKSESQKVTARRSSTQSQSSQRRN